MCQILCGVIFPLHCGQWNCYIARCNFLDGKTPLWTNDGHLTVQVPLLMTSQGSAGITLSLEFWIAFSRVFRSKMTAISLLLRKYTRRFVPRFPGIHEMLWFNLTWSRGIQIFHQLLLLVFCGRIQDLAHDICLCDQEQIRHNLYFYHFKFLCENSLSKSAFYMFT